MATPLLAKAPNIFYYTHYLDFLQDCYDVFHQADPSFSYTHIANSGSFRSRTQVRGIIKGSIKPNLSQLKQLALIFNLQDRGLQYLVGLYHFNKADNSSVAFDLFQQLIGQQNESEIKDNPFREIEIAASLLHLTILSLSECEGFSRSSKWIVEQLVFSYNEDEVEEALRELLELEYLIEEESGVLRLGQPYIKKIDHSSNFFLRRFHKECLGIALKSIDDKPMEDRFLIASTIAIPKQNFHRIKQKVMAFLDSVVMAEKISENKTDVLQLNVQMVRTAKAQENTELIKKEETQRLDEVSPQREVLVHKNEELL